VTRPIRLLPILAFAALLAGHAAAEEPAPPSGWEAPPPLAAPARKPVMPAGCSVDRTCRERQLANDTTPADRVARVVDVRFADLPALVVKEAPEGGPSLTGAPGLRFLVGDRPAPWSYVPKGEVRAEPVGAVGEITWGGGSLRWLEERMSFHRDGMARGSPSLGAIHTVPSDAKDLRSFFVGRIEYTTIDEGPGGALTVDYVTGELAGTPDLAVSRWGHAEAAAVVDWYVHAFQGRPLDDEATPGGEGGAVTFVLPSAWLEFEAKDAKHAGGFMRIGNTTLGSAFSSFTLPAGPGRSGIVSFRLAAIQIASWVPQPAGAE
jgi:hypothetical protein